MSDIMSGEQSRIPKSGDGKSIQYLPFHPPQPTVQKLNRKKSEKFHPYPAPASNRVNVPASMPILTATNINGILFHPQRYMTPKPQQSNDDVNWQITWIEQFDQYRKQCQTKEDELMKAVAQKNVDIGEYKSKCKIKEEIIERKTIQIIKYKSICEENDEIIKQKMIEIERCQAECKTKNELIERKEADIIKYKSLCEANDETIQQKVAEIEYLKSPLKAKDELISEHQQAAEIERYQRENKADDELQIATHSDTIKSAQKAAIGPTKYRCPKCSKYFNKKSSLDDHLTETVCAGEKKIDYQCEICKQMYTFKGLTRHLTQFITSKHKARGDHGNFDSAYHQILLSKHKSSRPQ